ncbi:hypothetical protein ACOME3_004752 [Neoechinorhynchus agilis]
MSKNEFPKRRESRYGIDVEEEGLIVKDTPAVLVRIDRPCHKISESLLTRHDNQELSYRGFFNLIIVLFHILYGRLAVENIVKYGSFLRHNPFDIIVVRSWSNPALRLLLLLIPTLLMLFALEKGISTRKIKQAVGRPLQILNLVIMITIPVLYIHRHQMSIPILYIAVCLLYVALFLASAPQRMRDFLYTLYSDRKLLLIDEIKKEKVLYPSNVTLQNFLYYLASPTLCYELSYPRSSEIRILFIIRELFETVMCLSLELLIAQKWIGPILYSSTIPLINLDYLQIIEKFMRLAVPTHLSWLLFFYITFHSFPNMIAEFLRFGDREFYLDWWNAQDIDEFWRKWNMPVHRWAKRHLYKPLLQLLHFPKWGASFVVFFVSAIFHEYVVSVPMCITRFWFFLGMGAQVPLGFIVRYFKGDRGNMAMWLSIVMGLPMIIMAYVHEFVVMNHEYFFAVPLKD